MRVFDFSGTYAHHLDPKGRVTIPSAFRVGLGDDFTVGMNNDLTALALYPKDEWQQFSRNLARIPESDARGMAYVRLIKSLSYTDQKLDGQGRLLVPAKLREKAGLVKEISFVGIGRCLEVWDQARLDRFHQATEADFASLMQYVNEHFFLGAEEDAHE